MKTIGIPYCYYPTTVLLVDDDASFISILEDSMKTPYRSFTNPYDAIRFLLSSEVTFSSLEKNCLTDESPADYDTSSFSVDITPIYKEIYDPARFDEVSVVIVDYQMPSMNGIEFCKSIRSSHFKIIMLTGEATHELAINAFNNCNIDKFIRKSTPNLHDELAKAIADVQFKHFQDVSSYVLNSFLNSRNPLSSFLQNESFVSFFKEVLRKNKISEFYLLNNSGDFLFITKEGEICYFVLRDNRSFEELLKFEVYQEYWSEPSPEATALFESIQRKEKIPFLWGLETLPEFVDWPIYPLKSAFCEGSPFYYALIKDDRFNRGLDLSKIAFFKA